MESRREKFADQKRIQILSKLNKQRLLTGVGLTTLGLASMISSSTQIIFAATGSTSDNETQTTNQTVNPGQSVTLHNDQNQNANTDTNSVASSTSEASNQNTTDPATPSVQKNENSNDTRGVANIHIYDASDSTGQTRELDTKYVFGNTGTAVSDNDQMQAILADLKAKGYTIISNSLAGTEFGDWNHSVNVDITVQKEQQQEDASATVDVYDVSDGTNKLIDMRNVSGKVGQSINDKIQDLVNELKEKGYDIVSGDARNNQFSGDANQHVTLSVKKVTNDANETNAFVDIYDVSDGTNHYMHSKSINGKVGEYTATINDVEKLVDQLKQDGYEIVGGDVFSGQLSNSDDQHFTLTVKKATTDSKDANAHVDIYDVTDGTNKLIDMQEITGKVGDSTAPSVQDIINSLKDKGYQIVGGDATSSIFTGDNNQHLTITVKNPSEIVKGTVHIIDQTSGSLIQNVQVQGTDGQLVDQNGKVSNALNELLASGKYYVVSDGTTDAHLHNGAEYYIVLAETNSPKDPQAPNISNPGYDHHDDGQDPDYQTPDITNPDIPDFQTPDASNPGYEHHDSEENPTTEDPTTETPSVQQPTVDPKDDVGTVIKSDTPAKTTTQQAGMIPTNVLTNPASTTTTTTTTTTSQKQLPKTGDDHAQASILATVGTALIGMLGLVGTAKHRRKN